MSIKDKRAKVVNNPAMANAINTATHTNKSQAQTGSAPVVEPVLAQQLNNNTQGQQHFAQNQSYSHTQDQQAKHVSRAQDLNKVLSRGNGLGRRLQGGNVVKIAETLADLHAQKKQTGNCVDVDIVPIDGSVFGMTHSVVVVVLETNESVFITNLLVENTGTKPHVYTDTIYNQQVEIERYTADCYDTGMKMSIADAIGTRYNKPVIDCALIVLPNCVGEDDFNTLFSYLFYAMEAVIARNGVDTGFCIKELAIADFISSRVEYGAITSGTPAGLPVRSDITITSSAVIEAAPGAGSSQQTKELVEVSAYVDFAYAEPIAPPQLAGYAPQPAPTACFIPKIVITAIESDFDNEPLEAQLLGLATVPVMRDNMAWIHQFRPTTGNGSKIREVGALGYEIPLNGDGKLTKVRTQTGTFDADSDLKALMEQVVNINPVDQPMIFCMDIEVGGPLSWLKDIFIASATEKEAYDEIIATANRLTDGEFSRVFQGGDIIATDIDTILLGYFEDEKTQEKQDLRNIDHVAMLNLLGAKDPAACVAYAGTFEKFDQPEAIRLHSRRRILQRVFPYAVITGVARRVVINPQFLQALVVSIAHCKVNMRTTNAVYHDQTVVRGNPRVMDYQYTGTANSMYAHHAGPQAQQGQQYHSARWQNGI